MENKKYFRILFYDKSHQDISEVHALDIIEQANDILKHKKVSTVSHAIEAICLSFKTIGVDIFFIDSSNYAVLSKEMCPPTLYDKVRNVIASRNLRSAHSVENMAHVLR